ncbi:hypothetical protein BGZ97_000362 [Linnemannia gamsii]|uniref:Uncharacterized protein n=1 Tax=Linnemannia gamsii TaxID=64522 RepID=A0A9P6UKG7_9FUNG|nr:hypothetical protein BGZ97_000362 [Linnemannia gamsii]
MNQYTDTFDEETETESEDELVDPRKTLPIDIASLDTAPLGVATPDEDDLITVQETITNAFEDFQDDLPPIDSNQDDAGDQSDAEEQSGAEDGFEGDPGNAEHAMRGETWMRKLEVARQRKRMKEWYSTRAHIFADERIATAAKVLSIDIDKRIDEFAVWENGTKAPVKVPYSRRRP